MKSQATLNAIAMQGLVRRWYLLLAVDILLVAFGVTAISGLVGLKTGLRWGVLVSLVLAVQLGLLRRGLAENHRPGETALFDTPGPANSLTLIRGIGLALVAGFLFSPQPQGIWAWAPAALYTVSSLGDFLDGYLARITNRITVLGGTLDMEFDSLGALVATLLAAWYGHVPIWFPVLGLYRYLFIFGIWWRRRRGLPVHDLPDSFHRRIVAALFMGFISVLLWPIVKPPATTLACILFAVPLTLSFGRDWLIVIGRIDPGDAGYRRTLGRLARIITLWLPLPLRLLVVGCAFGLLLSLFGSSSDWMDALAIPGLPWPQLTAAVGLVILVIATPMIAVGWLGRVAAVALVIPASANMLGGSLTWLNGLLLAGAITLLFIGTGIYSVWQPEDRIFTRRAGSPRD